MAALCSGLWGTIRCTVRWPSLAAAGALSCLAVTLIIKLDIKLKLVPNRLINYITEKVFPYIVEELRKVNSPGEPL